MEGSNPMLFIREFMPDPDSYSKEWKQGFIEGWNDYVESRKQNTIWCRNTTNFYWFIPHYFIQKIQKKKQARC